MAVSEEVIKRTRVLIASGMTHAAAAEKLGELGFKVSARTLKRRVKVADVRQSKASGAPTVPDSDRRSLPAGFRGLELGAKGNAQPAPRPEQSTAARAAPEPAPAQKPAPQHGVPGFRRVYLENIGEVIERLLPTAAPLDADGNPIMSLEELAMLCAAVLRTGRPPQLVALSCGLDPVRVDRIIDDGIADFGAFERTGYATIALAVLGHREACDSRLAETIVRAAQAGTWEAMRLARQITAERPLDLGKGAKKLAGPVADVVAALHRARGQDRRRLAIVQARQEREEQRVGVNAG